MGLFQQINTVWSKIGLVQKALLAAIVMACAITGVMLTRWASLPDMRLLYGNLGEEESGAISDKVSELGVPFELRNGGKSIYVPAEKVYTLRAGLAKEGLMPKEGEPGYEIFDNEKLGVSPLVQKLNYNRALQGELARTIQVFEGVEFARVHLVRPDQTMFANDDKKASASVMLRLQPGFQMSPVTVTAIANLIAGSVEGLRPQDVTVADSNGRMLSSQTGGNPLVSGANSYKDYKAAVEQDMIQRLQNSLEMVLGPGRATVIANAKLDMTQETVTKTTYEKGIPMEETVEETSNTTAAAPSSSENPDQPQTAGGSNTEKTSTTKSTNKIPETTTTTSTVPGKILGWSVSVIADLSRPAAAAENAAQGEQPQAQAPAAPAEIMSIEDVKEIVRTAIGSDLLKDSDLSVKNIAFYRPAAAVTLQEPSTLEKLSPILEIIRQSSMGILAICALLVLKIFTGAGKKAAADKAAAVGAHALGAGAAALLPAGNSEESVNLIRDQITLQLRDNPEQVKQLFSMWLAEGK
ncbi:MAG: flagellar M-ring protein FliF [Planctomycetaceae bacterium]|nr:flagellar M-ring protein FliF [Planctomycetaceae bacterium]